ncbi:MAG: methyltransferase domain-containing protein [Chloroflexi bacterium]|nr:methyltransferase domain-containing protein [Chloroflexota bacterium]
MTLRRLKTTRPDLFDRVSQRYDRLFPYGGPQRLLPLLQMEPGLRLLDIGGGTGRVAETLRGQAQVLICDPSAGMLRQAQEKGLRACAGLAERLPFADGAFDRVLVVDAFHHFADHDRAAAELLRVLHPGGRLVMEEQDIRHTGIKWVALAERLLRMRSRFFSLPDLLRLFQAQGAAVLAVEEEVDHNVRVVLSR